jgi:hypothetical protein
MSMPRHQQSTARQKRAESYEQQWQENRRRLGREISNGHNDKTPPLSGAELVRMLEQARDATGDPVFTAALDRVRFYGFDGAFKRTAAKVAEETWGDPLSPYCAQVEYLHKGCDDPLTRYLHRGRHNLSIREACERVVAESALPGPFITTVNNLRKLYQKRFSSR